MIIKVDHVTYSVDYSNAEMILQQYNSQGYIMKFNELNLPNIKNKKKFLAFEQDCHNMYFMEKANEIPIEIIAYDKTNKCSLMEMEGNNVKIYIKNSAEISGVLKKLGAKEIVNEKKYSIKGIFDKGDLIINLVVEKSVEMSYLDDHGLGCITLLVDSTEKVREQLIALGTECSEIEEILVAGRILNVMFVSSKEREFIVEIISKKR